MSLNRCAEYWRRGPAPAPCGRGVPRRRPCSAPLWGLRSGLLRYAARIWVPPRVGSRPGSGAPPVARGRVPPRALALRSVVRQGARPPPAAPPTGFALASRSAPRASAPLLAARFGACAPPGSPPAGSALAPPCPGGRCWRLSPPFCAPRAPGSGPFGLRVRSQWRRVLAAVWAGGLGL